MSKVLTAELRRSCGLQHLSQQGWRWAVCSGQVSESEGAPPTPGEHWSSFSADRNSKVSTERGGWALSSKETTCFSFSKSGKPSWLESSLEVKKGVNAKATHRPLCWNPSWLSSSCLHMGGSWDKPNADSEPAKSTWLAKGIPEEMPHIGDSNSHEDATLSLRTPACLVTCIVLFSLLINTLFHYKKREREKICVPY